MFATGRDRYEPQLLHLFICSEKHKWSRNVLLYGLGRQVKECTVETTLVSRYRNCKQKIDRYDFSRAEEISERSLSLTVRIHGLSRWHERAGEELGKMKIEAVVAFRAKIFPQCQFVAFALCGIPNCIFLDRDFNRKAVGRVIAPQLLPKIVHKWSWFSKRPYHLVSLLS